MELPTFQVPCLARDALAWALPAPHFCPLSLLPFVSTHSSLRSSVPFLHFPSLLSSAHSYQHQHHLLLRLPSHTIILVPRTPHTLGFFSTSQLLCLPCGFFLTRSISNSVLGPFVYTQDGEISAWSMVLNTSCMLMTP